MLDLNRIMNRLLWLTYLCSAVAHNDVSFKNQYKVSKYPFQDPSLPWGIRVDDLVARLTLDELVPQMQALYANATPAIPRLGIQPYVWISECLRGQLNTNTTSFPQAIGLAASFSPSLVKKVAEAVSYEVRAQWNNNVQHGAYKTYMGLSCFAPMVNIVRHPLWGRVQECYGEDPFLSGTLAQGYVYGLHGNHPRYVRASSGCKAYNVYAGPENIPSSRFSFDALITQRDLHMTFLPQYKMCVQAGTYNIMCSYNSVNGVPSCIDAYRLKKVLRQDWGFQGYVVSDAGALNGIIAKHKYRTSRTKTAAEVVKNGCNLELTGTVNGSLFSNLLEAFKGRNITAEEIRQATKPLFYTRMRLGEFDPPELNPYNKININEVQSKKHRDLAIQAAAKTYVLLKNDNNALPLKGSYNNVSIIGPLADDPKSLFGDYASEVVKQFVSTPRKGLSAISHSPLRYTDGCKGTGPRCTSYISEDIERAVVGSDLVFVCIGLGLEIEAEGNDRANLSVPENQLKMLKDAVKYNGAVGTVVLVLFNAGPLDISWAKNSPGVNAILECFYPAQSTGHALYKVVTNTGTGSVPAARLPVTWPASMSQVPPMVNYTMTGRTYRYFEGTPLYPFGYGLSYTKFNYSDIAVHPNTIEPGQEVTVKVTVANIGKYDADEVVQVYISWVDYSPPEAPQLQLAAYRRVTIPSGHPVVVDDLIISPDQMALAIKPDDEKLTVLKGRIKVFVGGQQPFQSTNVGSNILNGQFYII